MRLILTIALAALMLAACAPGMWDGHRTGPRWGAGIGENGRVGSADQDLAYHNSLNSKPTTRAQP